ncbi:hypothetical protein [uncultured Marivirga sp.]|uniref:hypothetical protein n=1 Tax=uncultured Marivirga sp. TaxID=1123707 RepID=UPI0030EE3DC3|tara:strand:- start:124751 stop:125260 length:510 start_codon:yes stop_codon:yes gene_type:complete
MLKKCLVIFFSSLVLNACSLTEISDEEDFKFAPNFEFVILNENGEHIIGHNSNQFHPDSMTLKSLNWDQIITEKFRNCGDSGEYVSPSLQVLGISRPWDSIDTLTFLISLSNMDIDTLKVYHYPAIDDDYYYKILSYNGINFDEQTNEYETGSCGSQPIYVVKNNIKMD